MPYNFFVTVHQDRLRDLALIIGDAPVDVEDYAMDDEGFMLVYIRGESDVTRRLDRVIEGVKKLLVSPLVLIFEVSPDAL